MSIYISSLLSSAGSSNLNIAAVNTNTTLTSANDIVLATYPGSNITITLPLASTVTRVLRIINAGTTPATNGIQIEPQGSDVIFYANNAAAGAVNLDTQGQSYCFVSDHVNTWYVYAAIPEVIAPLSFTVGGGSSGTYTTPAGSNGISPLYLMVICVGAGGGGSGGGATGGGTGGNGGATTFGSLITAGGGTGATYLGQGGAGGVLSTTGVTLVQSSNGNAGSTFATSTSGSNSGASGGAGPFGGGAFGGNPGNPGGGGNGFGAAGGGGSSNPGIAGNGGGAGAYFAGLVFTPLSSYAYSVGAGGSGGSAGTTGAAGGGGADGYLSVVAYFM